MGEIIDISSVRENIEKGVVPNDPSQLLKIVASSAKKSRGMKKDDFVNNPELFIRGKISSFLLEKEMINPDLFQCTLYVAKIVSNKFNKIPESYYAIDYS